MQFSKEIDFIIHLRLKCELFRNISEQNKHLGRTRNISELRTRRYLNKLYYTNHSIGIAWVSLNK